MIAACNIFFLSICIRLSGFHKMSWEVFSTLIMARVCRNGIISSLNGDRILSVMPFGPGVAFVGMFLITNSIMLIGITLIDFLLL